MSTLAIATLVDGRMQSFLVDDNNTLWSRWQIYGSVPLAWGTNIKVLPTPGAVVSVAATAMLDGSVTVMVGRTDGTFAISQKPGTDPNAGWSAWVSI
jgi:hypothetical protein